MLAYRKHIPLARERGLHPSWQDCCAPACHVELSYLHARCAHGEQVGGNTIRHLGVNALQSGPRQVFGQSSVARPRARNTSLDLTVRQSSFQGKLQALGEKSEFLFQHCTAL